jgi:hypothetical protein
MAISTADSAPASGSSSARAEAEHGRQRLAAQQPLPGQETQTTQDRNQHPHGRNGRPLAQRQGQRAGRVHQQRLQRTPLALACGGVQSRVQGAVEHGHQNEERQHEGQLRTPRGRAGEVELLHLYRLQQGGRHPAHQQA